MFRSQSVIKETVIRLGEGEDMKDFTGEVVLRASLNRRLPGG